MAQCKNPDDSIHTRDAAAAQGKQHTGKISHNETLNLPI